MRFRILILLATAALLAAGCRSDDTATQQGGGDTEPGEAAATAPPPAPPVPASEQLMGVWEHVSDVGGTEVRLGYVFTADALVRTTRGVETARQDWTIVAESELEVTADVTDGDGRVARHTWRIVAPETLVHTATPDIEYRRVGDAPTAPVADGSGASTEGSGVSDPG